MAGEVIRTIQEEGLIDRCREMGAYLISGLEGVKTRTGKIKDVRGRGLMVAREMEDDAPADADASFARWTQGELLRNGFIVGRRPDDNVLRLDPSLTIDREDIEAFLEALSSILNRGNREGKA